jgi:glycosyltransferase involved in cell wall biosynthesis
VRVLLYRSHLCHGGITSWIWHHGRQLRRLGADCTFWFADNLSTRLAEFDQLGGVIVGPLSDLFLEAERGTFDVIHVVNQDPTAEILTWIRPPVRIVATSHGDLSEVWRRKNCFAYTAVSEDMAAANQPLTDLEVEVIPNGVDCDWFTPPSGDCPGDPIVAWVGRSLDPRKDFPRFTRVAARLARSRVRLWVADAHAATWEQFKDGNCERVCFERWQRIAHSEMPRFYQEVAATRGLLLMTSCHEGWGLVASEAAACGVATLGPNVVGLRQAIQPQVTGELYPPDASDAEVADRVLATLDARQRDSSTAARCAAAARQSCSGEAVARRYLDLYSREEQRPRPAVRGAADNSLPGFAGLQRRLIEQRPVRAGRLSYEALSLARAGRVGPACRALWRSFWLNPPTFRRWSRWHQILPVVKAIALRSLPRVFWQAPSSSAQVPAHSTTTDRKD